MNESPLEYVKDKKEIALSIIEKIGIRSSIRNLIIENTESPWLEKIIIDGEKEIDVKTVIWDDGRFIFGRIYRLLLYASDVLSREFLYDPKHAPDKQREPVVKRRYNQIWSLAVDSRVERIGVESFYDKQLRKNLFCDSERGVSRGEAGAVFDMLWQKQSFTFPEIVDYSRNLDELLNREESRGVPDRFELDINTNLKEPSVRKHLRRLSSDKLAKTTDELLSFVA